MYDVVIRTDFCTHPDFFHNISYHENSFRWEMVAWLILFSPHVKVLYFWTGSVKKGDKDVTSNKTSFIGF